MATSQPGLNGHENDVDHNPDHGLSELSLSSKTIHADDYLNIGQDVAPPLHVSTTFRYNRDPNALKVWSELEVLYIPSPTFKRKSADQLIARTHERRTYLLQIHSTKYYTF